MQKPKPYVPTSPAQQVFRNLLGIGMLLAGFAHLTFKRIEFQAQVPQWAPLGDDFIVLASGIVEMGLALVLLFWEKHRVYVGIALATFYILIFPGNIAQYLNGVDAFGLDTDQKRLIRLFFQPVLILWALWCTGFFRAIRKAKAENET
ncbi:MAG: hypothetical protein ACOCZ8_01265 [Bacteroidota bacterium]